MFPNMEEFISKSSFCMSVYKISLTAKPTNLLIRKYVFDAYFMLGKVK